MPDFSKYQPPGLYTEAVNGPQLAVNASTPTSVGIFGLAVGYQTHTESVEILPDAIGEGESEPSAVPTRTLARNGIIVSSVVVRNPASGQVYAEGTDFTVEVAGTGSDPSSNRDDTYYLRRVIDGGHILAGDIVEVSYRYTDENYFTDRTFWDFDDVRDSYGPAFNAEGTIISELTLAARLAFQNGASSVVCVAVDTADPSQPALDEYVTALNKLSDNPDISVIVPATGMQALHVEVLSHVSRQSQAQFERRAILGRDGSQTSISSSQLIQNANALSSRRVALVSPTKMSYFSSEANREVSVGGQFLAAALAGLSVSLRPSTPLTRKRVIGFSDIGRRAPETEKSLESQNGLMVIEKTREGQVRVRHGVTTDPSTYLDREWSVTGQEDTMLYRLRRYLDNNQIIGGIINDITLVTIKATVDSTLQSLVSDQTINGYSDLKVRQLDTQPDVVEIRFAWNPAMPLNYIVVRYSVNVTTGEIGGATGSV